MFLTVCRIYNFLLSTVLMYICVYSYASTAKYSRKYTEALKYRWHLYAKLLSFITFLGLKLQIYVISNDAEFPIEHSRLLADHMRSARHSQVGTDLQSKIYVRLYPSGRMECTRRVYSQIASPRIGTLHTSCFTYIYIYTYECRM